MMSDWKPEVGRDCLLSKREKVLVHAVCGSYAWISRNENLNPVPFTAVLTHLSPIQTQADKYRDEQKTYLRAIVCQNSLGCLSLTEKVPKSIAQGLYNSGVRVLADDEVIVKPLSDEQIEELCARQDLWRGDVIAIQRELGVIK